MNKNIYFPLKSQNFTINRNGKKYMAILCQKCIILFVSVGQFVYMKKVASNLIWLIHNNSFNLHT